MKKLKLLVLFLLILAGGTLNSTSPILYIIANGDLKKDEKTQNLIDELQKYLEKQNETSNKKYFSHIKILLENKIPEPSESGDYYLFLFGWKQSLGKTTTFFNYGGYFSPYQEIDKKNNPFLVVFIPLDTDAEKSLKVYDWLKTVKFHAIEKVINFEQVLNPSEITNFSFILDWIKNNPKNETKKKEPEKNVIVEQKIENKKENSVLYIIANGDLYRDKKTQNLIYELQKYLDEQNTIFNKKYFSHIQILQDNPENLSFGSDDHYLFLFGWKKGNGKSTKFFNPGDGYFKKYAKAGKNNPFLVIFVPLDAEADVSLKENYTRSVAKHLDKDLDLKSIIFKPILDFSQINNFSFILDWIEPKTELETKQEELINEKKTTEIIHNFAAALHAIQ